MASEAGIWGQIRTPVEGSAMRLPFLLLVLSAAAAAGPLMGKPLPDFGLSPPCRAPPGGRRN